jgi:hypothetical protein
VGELELGARLDDDHAVRLGELAHDLGEELRGRHADRCGEAGLVKNAHAEVHGDFATGTEAATRATHVEERLVDRERLDQRGDRAEDRHHFAALRFVLVEARWEEHGLRAGASCPRHRHRRSDAVGARFVARGGDDTARAEPADDDGLPRDLRVEQHLDRRVERVEVDVQDRRVRGRGAHAVRTTSRALRSVPRTS